MTLARLPHPDYPMPLDQASGNQWIDLVKPAADLASMIAQTEFVPAEMRNKPAAIAACILYGAEIGIGPMQSLAKIDLVKGRPAPRAELARALALAAGHEVWVESQSNTACKVSGRRRGSQQVQSSTWTMDDVKKAGIASGMYSKYPRQMLLARASAELVRMMCPDVLGGIGLFAEEVVDADEQSAPAATTETPATARQTRKRAQPIQATHTPAEAPVAAAVADDAPPLPDELDATPDGMVTAAQIKKMMASFNEVGLKERNDRLDFIAAAVRRVDTSKDLTVDEASTVIDAIDKCINGGATLVIIDGGMELHYDDESTAT